MSNIYTVKSGDTFYGLFLHAKKADKKLRYETFKKANSHIKSFKDLQIGDRINIPKSKPKRSVSAIPTEGKCGNKFTFNPRGKNALSLQVKCSVNGKSSPTLEAEETYTLEHNKLEESQQGSLDITINGKKTSIIKDLAPFKDKISKHKDIKVDVTVVDKDITVPAVSAPSLEVLKAIADSNKDTELLKVNIPEEFRSPDQDATMTPRELMTSQTIHYNHTKLLESLGIHSPVQASEKHSMVVVELPPNIHLDTGIFNIDEMKDEAVEKFTQAMAIAMAPGNKEALSKLVAELFTLGMIPGLAKEKKAFWKQMGLKGKYVTSIENGKKLVQFYPTTHFTAAWKTGATRAEQKKLKKGLVKYNKKYTLGHTAFDKQLKQAIPFLVKTKVGYLEKFIAGLSRGGTVISIIFIGGADTAKWYFDKKSQSVDLWAIWGVAIATGVIAAVAYNVTATVTAAILTATAVAAGSIVLTVGFGVIASVAVAWAVGSLLKEYKVKENLINLLRELDAEN